MNCYCLNCCCHFLERSYRFSIILLLRHVKHNFQYLPYFCFTKNYQMNYLNWCCFLCLGNRCQKGYYWYYSCIRLDCYYYFDFELDFDLSINLLRLRQVGGSFSFLQTYSNLHQVAFFIYFELMMYLLKGVHYLQSGAINSLKPKLLFLIIYFLRSFLVKNSRLHLRFFH